MHVCTLFTRVGNSLTDSAEMWYVDRDPSPKRFTEVNGGVQVHVRTPFQYLGNDFVDCAEIWCVAMRPLAMRFTKDGGYLLERTCNYTHIQAPLFTPTRSSPKR